MISRRSFETHSPHWAESSDRTSPTVFVGRKDELGLLDSAVRGVQRDEAGHTVVVQGLPGAGKTALLNEYAARLLTANAGGARPIIPVPLQPGAVNALRPPLFRKSTGSFASSSHPTSGAGE